ncbi:hypothetical protein EON77_06310, partial [bacterium]
MPITHWPPSERPREKLLHAGTAWLTDGELLAVLFGSGHRGHSAVDVGRTLLAEFGGLRSLLQAPRT